MGAYGQFCPVAKAMELLDERWTMLVIRELEAGSHHFNDLRRGVPRMSPALLSKRLRTLVAAGVVERREDGNRVVYALTSAGEELGPIVQAIGRWGTRWVPDAKTILRFSFRDVPAGAADWWLVITPTDVDVCDFDPGYDVDATVEAELRALTEVWRGDVTGATRFVPVGCTSRLPHTCVAPCPAGWSSPRWRPCRVPPDAGPGVRHPARSGAALA